MQKGHSNSNSKKMKCKWIDCGTFDLYTLQVFSVTKKKHLYSDLKMQLGF